MQTQTQIMLAPLPVIHDLARIAALYASDDAQRPALQLVTLNPTSAGLEAVTTDSYAMAVWATNNTHNLTNTISVNAHDLHKATNAAMKAIGKRHAENILAQLTFTLDAWTLTAGPLTTTGEPNTLEPITTAAIREAMNPTTGTTFEPYNMGAFQLARLAKTNPNGPDAKISHTTYHTALRPMTYATEYDVCGHTINVQILAMPQR